MSTLFYALFFTLVVILIGLLSTQILCFHVMHNVDWHSKTVTKRE